MGITSHQIIQFIAGMFLGSLVGWTIVMTMIPQIRYLQDKKERLVDLEQDYQNEKIRVFQSQNEEKI